MREEKVCESLNKAMFTPPIWNPYTHYGRFTVSIWLGGHSHELVYIRNITIFKKIPDKTM